MGDETQWGWDSGTGADGFEFNFNDFARNFANGQRYEWGGHYGGFRNQQEEQRKRRAADLKSHLFQGYKGVSFGKFKEISLEEFKKDFPGKEPKFWNKPFYYAQRDGRDYIIRAAFPLVVIYNHADDEFLYMRADKSLFKERNGFATDAEVADKIRELEKQREGTMYITHPNGATYPYRGN